MKTFDIKSGGQTVLEAQYDLENILKMMKHEVAIKIIHGYGSHGVGGKIKHMTHHVLNECMTRKRISGFLPGEATTSLIGFDQLIHRYLQILKQDSDFHRGNDGITYVFFR